MTNHGIRQIFLHVTKACNLNCQYCYYAARKSLPDELSSAELSALFNDFLALGRFKLVVTGGEPLLRPDILRLLGELKASDREHRITRCLNTNGLLVTKSLAKAMVGIVDEVRVSLDGLKYRNDLLRGAGSFDAALRAIDTLYRVGFEPKVLVTLTAVSQPDLDKLVTMLLHRGVRRINVNVFRTIGRGAKRHDLHANAEAARHTIAAVYQRFGLTVDLGTQPGIAHKNCGAGQYLNIAANGDVFPCHVMNRREFRCGNVRNDCLVDICQKNSLLEQLRELDFQKVADAGTEFAPLSEQHACLGEVYASGRHDKWQKLLPLSKLAGFNEAPLDSE